MFQGVGLLSPKHSLQLPPFHSSPRRARPTKHGKNVKNARLLLLPASDTPTPAFQLRLRGDQDTGPRMHESKPREVRRLHRLLQLKRLLVNVSLAWKHSLLAKPKRWLSCENVYFCECVCVSAVCLPPVCTMTAVEEAVSTKYKGKAKCLVSPVCHDTLM